MLTILCLLVTVFIFRSTRRDLDEGLTMIDHPRHRAPLGTARSTASRAAVGPPHPRRLPISSASSPSCWSSWSTRWSGCSSARSRPRASSSTSPFWALPAAAGRLRQLRRRPVVDGELRHVHPQQRHRGLPLARPDHPVSASPPASRSRSWCGRAAARCCCCSSPASWCPTQMILLPLFTIYFQLRPHRHAVAADHHLHRDRPAAHGVHDGDLLPRGAARDLRGRDPRRREHLPDRSGRSASRWCATRSSPSALVQFFFLWNDLLIALTFTNSDDLRTIQVGLLNFTGQYGAVAVRTDLRRDLRQRPRDAADLPLPQPAGHEGPDGRIGEGLT